MALLKKSTMAIGLILLSILKLSAQYAFPVNDTFETDPLGSRLTITSNVLWSTEQSESANHSVKLINDTGGWAGDSFRAAGEVTGVPQAGFVEFAWSVYFSGIPTDNKLYLMILGSNQHPASNGIGDILVVGGQNNFEVCDGEGNWLNTGVAMALNTWTRIRVVLNQDVGTYNMFIKVGAAAEQQVRQTKPIINQTTRFGDGSHPYFVSYASITSTYYLDNLEIKVGSGAAEPTPTPTPVVMPYPNYDDFETSPGMHPTPWAFVLPSAMEWSTDQARSGARSIRLTAEASHSDSPRLVADLSNAPQTGRVQVLFDLYPVATGGNVCQFAQFGNQFTQVTGGYQILTAGYFPTDPYPLRVQDFPDAWNDGQAPTNVALNSWTRHRFVFDQDALSYEYYVTPDGQPEYLVAAGSHIGGAKIGDPAYPYFASIPFGGGWSYYIDNFLIGPPGGQPPVNSAKWWALNE